MRYSFEPSYRKYVQGQGFMSFAKNIGNKYGRKLFDKGKDVGKKYGKKYGNKLLDNSISAGNDFAEIAGKKVLTKSAEATGKMIGNKIADRITKSSRNKAQKEDDRIMEETQELIIPPEKREQIVKDFKLFWLYVQGTCVCNTYKMEYDKINNLLGSESENLSKFVTRYYVRVNSLSNTYNENKSIRFKNPMLRSDLCDYADAYILVNGTITATANGDNNNANNIRDKRNRPLILKNNAPFVSCITKINGELIEDAEDLDIVMPMYNLLEYSKNYRKTIGSFYNYCRDKLGGNANNNDNTVNSNTFKYKNKITGNTYNVAAGAVGYIVNKNGTKNIELAIPLKYLGNFWRALNMPLISCEVSLELEWNKNFVITSLERRAIDKNNPPNRDGAPTGATLAINDCKLYIPVVTLSKDDEI